MTKREYVIRSLPTFSGKFVEVKIPIIPDIAVQILERAAEVDGLAMNKYHTCKNKHCIMGWAVVIASLEHLDANYSARCGEATTPFGYQCDTDKLGSAILEAAGYEVSYFSAHPTPNKIYIGCNQYLGETSLEEAAIEYLDKVVEG